MNIITISREFGSGGRELGKRLADELDFEYYDREIIQEIAEKNKLDENYVASIIESGITYTIPITYGRTFFYQPASSPDITQILASTGDIIKAIAAKGKSFVIVGRASDIILENYRPFNIFVYANMQSKILRCKSRISADEQFTDKELEKEIRRIDSDRAKHRKIFTNEKFGYAESYHLCVNTTGLNIKSTAHSVSLYARMWFENMGV